MCVRCVSLIYRSIDSGSSGMGVTPSDEDRVYYRAHRNTLGSGRRGMMLSHTSSIGVDKGMERHGEAQQSYSPFMF